jgi:hypothetical protein
MAEPMISTQPIAEKKNSYRKWIEAEAATGNQQRVR